MIFLIGFVIIITITIVAMIRSKKPVSLILNEAKFEILYNALGSESMLQDIVMKGKNKNDFPKQTGKVALITGGTRGIGLAVVKMLLKSDLHVIIGCRNVQLGETLLQTFRTEGITTGDITVYSLDISSFESIKKFAKIFKENHPKLHYLINCAGIMFGPYIETLDGFESQFSTNYLGHFLLTHLLLPHIKAAGEEKVNARIVNVSSCAHKVGDIKFEDINCRNSYIPAEAYSQSKLAQILFANYLDAILKKNGDFVQVHSLHPGIVNTELFDGTHLKNIAPWFPGLLFKSPERGATPIVYACLSPELENLGGTYINNCVVFPTSEKTKCVELQKKFFEFTKELLKIEEFGVPG